MDILFDREKAVFRREKFVGWACRPIANSVGGTDERLQCATSGPRMETSCQCVNPQGGIVLNDPTWFQKIDIHSTNSHKALLIIRLT
jgi:hypothetical protein